MSSKDKKGSRVQPETQRAQSGGLAQNISDKLRKKREEQKFKVSNKYDPYALKDALDEYTKEYLFQKHSVKEIHSHSNTKILLGFIIVAIVLTAQFYPLEFPKNYNLTVVCVILYFIISTYLSYYESRVVGDIFFRASINGIEAKIENVRELKLESKIEQYSDKYTFKFTVIDPQTKNHVYQATEILYYGDYFNEKGDLVIQNMDKLLKSLLKASKI